MKKLHWDTNHWGVDIFDIDLSSTEFEFYKSKNPYIIQTLIDLNDKETICRAEKYKFSFVETKITLLKEIKSNPIQLEPEISKYRVLKLEEISNLKEEFYNLFGGNTRFNIFPKNKINSFYYLWVINSIKGTLDDQCIGYFHEGELAGFITYKTSESDIRVGLLGVFTNFQGIGIAKKLLNYVEYLGVSKGVINISIATQGTNLNAINAYIKSGFKIKHIENWYYYMKGVN